MKLIEEWKSFYKWYSVHVIILFSIMPGVWEAIPHEWRDSIPQPVLAMLAAVMGVSGVLGRITEKGNRQDVNQTPNSPEERNE